MKRLFIRGMFTIIFLFVALACQKQSDTSQSTSESAGSKDDTTVLNFSDLFQQNNNGTVSPKSIVKLGPVTMTPAVSFQTPISFKGVDITGKKVKVKPIEGGYEVIAVD
jgi:hypothetical protein